MGVGVPRRTVGLRAARSDARGGVDARRRRDWVGRRAAEQLPPRPRRLDGGLDGRRRPAAGQGQGEADGRYRRRRGPRQDAPRHRRPHARPRRGRRTRLVRQVRRHGDQVLRRGPSAPPRRRRPPRLGGRGHDARRRPTRPRSSSPHGHQGRRHDVLGPRSRPRGRRTAEDLDGQSHQARRGPTSLLGIPHAHARPSRRLRQVPRIRRLRRQNGRRGLRRLPHD
mmetsp:Transcript_8052/g.20883  ORF Transcript_8052/g.20883 Transcript_8052/m.20883 type:complete len:224 (+) Transcript_8052:48-719(+)